MKSKQLETHGEEVTWALVLDQGDEVMATLTAFARQRGMTAGHFTAIGAFSEVTLGYFDRESKDYVKIPVPEQVEVLSLIGDLALDAGQPKLHAHVVVGKRDGSAHGGHLLRATVWPTLEVVLTMSPKQLVRRMDTSVGLALIDLDAA